MFGSPYTASKIFFHDLKILEWPGVTQIRDGVAIDRDSERAVDKFKYDFETVSPSSTFDMEIWLENPSDNDLGLACIGMNEFLSGIAYIGGNRSRGLGNCIISNLCIYKLDLTGKDKEEQLKKYITNTKYTEKMNVIEDPEQFINDQIEKILGG